MEVRSKAAQGQGVSHLQRENCVEINKIVLNRWRPSKIIRALFSTHDVFREGRDRESVCVSLCVRVANLINFKIANWVHFGPIA